MSDRDQRADRIRAAHPHFKVRRNKADLFVTAAEMPDEYETMVQRQVDGEIEREAQAAAETAERTRRETVLAVLDAIENGTAAQALAGLRTAVPWLVRQRVREMGE